MNSAISIKRFREPFRLHFQSALTEIKKGRKTTHWMWFIFPQLRGLGKSAMANLYGLENIEEACWFLQDEELGQGLIEITNALLGLKTCDAYSIFGSPDDMKLRSSMTLFSFVSEKENIFKKILIKFFNGEDDPLTLALLQSR